MDQSRNFGGTGSMYDHGRAVSTVTSPVVSDFRRGGLKGFLERSLSPEVMLTRSSLDVPPAEKAVRSWIDALLQIASFEAEGHHPDISFGWGYATVSLQTKKIKGLHENDFIMAAKLDDRMVGG